MLLLHPCVEEPDSACRRGAEVLRGLVACIPLRVPPSKGVLEALSLGSSIGLVIAVCRDKRVLEAVAGLVGLVRGVFLV